MNDETGMASRQDHFSTQSKEYRQFRPVYPDKLFEYISNLCHERDLAWDCGAGNGQAANGLADYFNRVIATDISQAQINQAITRDNISYSVVSAEQSPVKSDSVDLVVVAQALHWFNRARFFKEVDRVLKIHGHIAVITYALPRITVEIDKIVLGFHDERLGHYWAANRKMVVNHYKDIALPYGEIPAPALQIEAKWNLNRFIDYIRTWSAVVSYREKNDHDPTVDLRFELSTVWREEEVMLIRWPLTVKAGQKS